MKLQTLAAAAALTLSLAAPAFAADGVSATLQTPLAQSAKVIAGGSVFFCADTACVASSATNRTLTARACKDLVKEVGPVSTYGGERKQLGADDLARCNAAAN